MCYNFQNKGVDLKQALKDFDVEETDTTDFTFGSINAFVKNEKPIIPAIVNHNGISLINTFWGVVEQSDAPTKGKNLRAENTNTYYKKIEKNRCLIPASSYFEYKTVPVSGKKTPLKLKHEMAWRDLDQFYIAGFYDIYKDGSLGFGLVTTIPNPVQAEIHNRMIITLNPKTGNLFLDGGPIEDFVFPAFSPDLVYKNLEPEKLPNTLF